MKSNAKIPSDKALDNSVALLREGYRFIPNRMSRYQSDIFHTRLLGEKVTCISGKEGARIFYNNELFQRKGAAPKRIQKTLFGENAIQAMDGRAHEHRKLLFMNLMTPERLQKLAGLTTREWETAAFKWEKRKKVVLKDETEEILCRAACKWAGVPIKEQEVSLRAKDFGDMVDAFGAIGPRHWNGRKARERTEKWIREVIEDIRKGERIAQEDTAAYAMAWHRELDGNPLDEEMATVELINVLRPIVAIATFITFGALAVHDYPEVKRKLEENEGAYIEMFVQEVRRYYPFGPFLGARVRKAFIWNECKFKEGQLVLLDVFGINHDPRLWEDPGRFRPERFNDWNGGLFDLIPQGGGDYFKHHRCPGEMATVEVMKASLDFLSRQIQYEVPKQDMSISLSRMPTLPKSGFVIQKVKWK